MSLDLNVYYNIFNVARTSDFTRAVSIFFATCLFWFLLAWFVIALVWHKKTGVKEFIVLLIGGGMGYLFNKIISVLWFRPRPFVTEHLIPLIHKAVESKSFPSDHAMSAFFIATVLVLHKRSWWWTYVLAVAIAIGRVAVGVHYPTDILVGALIGVVLGHIIVRFEKNK